jgi:hypothetical protein
MKAPLLKNRKVSNECFRPQSRVERGVPERGAGNSFHNILSLLNTIFIFCILIVLCMWWADWQESRYWPKTRVVTTNNWYVEAWGGLTIKEKEGKK